MAYINGKEVLFSSNVNTRTINVEVAQTTGDSETAVMSQKAITDTFREVVDIEKSLNLFNFSSTEIKQDVFLNAVGVEVASPDYFISHAIKVKPNTPYVITYLETVTERNVGSAFTSNNEFVTCISGVLSTDGIYTTFIIPDNNEIAYIKINGNVYRGDTIMLLEGTEYPTNFVPYFDPIKMLNKDVKLASTQIEQVKENIKDEKDNPLWNKSITFNGDSICYGAGASGGYGKIIAEQNNMIYQNIGVSGATIATGTTLSNGYNRHWICDTIANMDTSADYAIVEGGANDAGIRVPLGEMSNGFRNTFDTTTFYGAFEYMLSQLLKRFAGKKIGYIAVHKMVNGFLSKPIYSTENTSYYDAAKACCGKWGVPFLDLNTTVPPFGYFDENKDAELYALKTAYTHDGDGWHPNDEGYKKYYVPKIEAWLKTL